MLCSVIPESHNQDTVGCLARTVKDATYCLDGIYGPDPRDNYTLVQQAPAGGFAQFLCDKGALKGAVFGLPWLSFWQLAPSNQQEQLLELIDLIQSAGATIINGTELPYWQTIVSPDGWNCRCWGRNPFPILTSLMILSRDKLMRQCPNSPETIVTEQLLTPPLPRGLWHHSRLS